MENAFLIYGTIAAVAVGFFVFHAARSDESYARKWAKVRVPVDERSRKHIEDHPEDDHENVLPLEWLMIGFGFVLVVLLLNAL